jgi:Spy/CpxP family protein refolding chaperone
MKYFLAFLFLSGAAHGAGLSRLQSELFEPKILHRHRKEIKLTGEQEKAILAEKQRYERETLDLQNKLEDALEELIAQVKSPTSTDPALEAASHQVLELESAIKTKRLLGLVRVRRLLDATQIQALQKLAD